MIRLLLLLLAAPALVAPSRAQPIPVQPTDLFLLRQLGDVALSPSGRQVLFTVRQAYRDGDGPDAEAGYRTQLWTADLTGREAPRALTTSDAGASQPDWHPSGDAVAFVRAVDGVPQVHVLPLLGGEARVVTDEPSGATSPRFSPDGRRLLYASSRTEAELIRAAGRDLPFRERPAYRRPTAAPDPDGALGQIQAYLDSSRAAGQARVVDRLDFQGETDLAEQLSFRHLFSIAADGSGVPALVAGGLRSYGGGAWLPAGGVVVSAAPGADRDADLRVHPDREQRSALYVAQNGRLRLLAQADSMAFFAPTPAPDGSAVAFLASDLREAGFAQTEVGVVPLGEAQPVGTPFPGGGSARKLTGALDRSASSLDWSPEARFVYFTAASGGGFPLYRVAPFGAFETPQGATDSLATDETLLRAMIRAGALPDSLAPEALAGEAVADAPGEAVAPSIAGGDDPLAILVDTLDASLDRIVADSLAALGPPVERLTELTLGVRAYDADQSTAVLVRTTAANPFELVRMDLTSGEQQTLYDANDWIAGRIVAPMTPSRYRTPDGLLVDYWTIAPVGVGRGERAPIVLEIHGGPMAMWGPGEASMWHEFQMLAGRGMGVVFANPRGSGGYGRAFRRANRQRWGDLPARDVLGALDRALAEQPWADPDRQGVTGGSYAGYLTAWIVSQTDRFEAAVAQRGVYDLATFFGEGNAWRLVPTHMGGYPWQQSDSVAFEALTDADALAAAQPLPVPAPTLAAAFARIDATAGDLELLVGDLDALPQIAGVVADSLRFDPDAGPALRRLVRELSALPGLGRPVGLVGGDTLAFDRVSTREVLARNSPLTYADRITTPLLILHGSNDLRTGVIQSEMLYRTLKVLGRPVEYVRYPDAGHDLSRTGAPQQRLDRLLRIYEFLARHLEG